MTKRKSRFVSFSRIEPKQIFEYDNNPWVKLDSVYTLHGITFNAFLHNIHLPEHLLRCQLSVRLYDDATLVNVSGERTFFEGEVDFSPSYKNDN